MDWSRTNRAGGKRTNPEDSRYPFQIDRDRVLLSSYFRRLAGVTQVVSPQEGHVFHNRLTHTIKVAQVGRRLAERLSRDFKDILTEDKLGEIDPDVVETACLAHDLGHPPFGHTGEHILDRMLRNEDRHYPWPQLPDGYEGNAQSFRIITNLSLRADKAGEPINGLELTFASLEAVLKYPWLRELDHTGSPVSFRARKFGAYRDEMGEPHEWHEENLLEEVRPPLRRGTEKRSIEAEVMDLADDIAYAVHDLEDFYRAGLVPAAELWNTGYEATYFSEQLTRRGINQRTANQLVGTLHTALNIPRQDGGQANQPLIYRPYDGTDEQRARLRRWTSLKIREFIFAATLSETADSRGNYLSLPEPLSDQVEALKEVTRVYVITNPALATHQHGHERILEGLFNMYWDAHDRGRIERLPRSVVAQARRRAMDPRCVLRSLCDFVSTLTDQEALRLHQRLSGQTAGSINDFKTL